MKRKQTLLVVMTALFCAVGAGQLWAATAAETTHLNNNVRIESITKRLPTNTEIPVATEVYFDVKLKDLSAKWELTSNAFDVSGGARPYLLLDMPLKGTSSKLAAGTEAASTEETATAVAYYVGPGATADTLRFAYVVRPGDMSTNVTWATTAEGAPAFGGDLKSVKLTAIDTTTGPLTGSVNLSDVVMQGQNITVADTGATIPVSGYTFTVGDADNNNAGILYAGLVPVTVTTIGDATTRSVLTSSTLYSKGYFWVEDVAGNQYYNVGVTSMTSDGVSIKEGDYDTTTATAFPETLAAKVSGMNNAAFTSQKFMVSVPASLAGQTVRLCYGVRRDNAASATTYAYATYTVEDSPVPTATAGYTVTNANMTKGTITLPNEGLKAAYTNLTNAAVNGGSLTLGAGETVSFIIKKNGVDALADYGTLYASIELISANNEANAAFERYYVPISADGTYKVKLSIGDTDTIATSYYRVRVPALESANGVGATEKPFYIAVSSSPKRESITIVPSQTTGSVGVEAYQPKDAAEGTAAGNFTILEYTLSVPAADDARYFIIYPTDETYTHRIDKNATMANVTDANGNAINAYNLIASYASLQAQGGGALPTAAAELRVTVPAGETSVNFYVVCRNDYPQTSGLLMGEVNVADSATPVKLAGPLFVAKTCNSAGEITGLLDECAPILPMVTNRAPMIQSAPSGVNAATGSAVSFSFTVADTKSDYLILTMTYGDGAQESVLMANEATMIAMMGKAAWDATVAQLKQLYGSGPDKTLPIIDRVLDSQTHTFTHTYTTGSASEWFFAVTDSAMSQTTTSGGLSLQTSQNFIFNTIYNQTRPGSGYVLWDNGTDVLTNWTFGSTYTSNALTKNGGNTLVTVAAYPFPADYLAKNPGDAATLARYTGLSKTLDSFFYKWSANSDFEAILPTGATEEYRRYEDVLSFNRAYVKDGEATDSSKWQDIQLSAIFVAEYLSSDSLSSRAKDSEKPYLYELGDYNQDGVPDGWLLRHMGADARATLVEGGSAANGSPAEAEYLPNAGFGSGDAAYKLGDVNRIDRLPPANVPPCAMTGTASAFGYKMRIRGRDDALNAADGNGNWLSHPAWVVLVHPEETIGEGDTEETVVRAGSVNNGVFTPAWDQVRLLDKTSAADGVQVAFTDDNKIPYDATTVVDGWAYVIDIHGNPIKAGAGTYKANNIMVCTDKNSDDYEAFRYTYNKWGVNKDGGFEANGEAGALFPFATKDESDNAMAGKGVDAYAGQRYEGTYCFIDARAVAGILLDEPFANKTNANKYIDPRLTSWLDRFGAANDDTDGDGIKNAADYYFWYYASRIAYASVFVATEKNADDKDEIVGVQINSALWPAIDMRKRENMNTDGRYATADKFVMGRRFRPGYNPDATENAYYDEDFASYPGQATRGKGNYWEPIPVENVMAAFDPFAPAAIATDTDNDGLSNLEELAIGTNPLDCDTDDDWIPDGWEVKYNLDPCNIANNGANDAEMNPDNDFFARAEVRLYPDYHHLFKVTLTEKRAEGEDPAEPQTAYYDVEDKMIRFFDEDVIADVAERKRENQATEMKLAKAQEEYDIAWVNEDPIFLEMNPKNRILRDFDVYRAFGFTAGTATPLQAINTAPFTSREEYNSGLLRGDTLDPTNPDTDGDGLPDGWALYVNLHANPPAGHGAADGTRDLDGDGLTCAQEYAYGSLTGWTNKTAPTDPWNPDTDFDGLWDGKEGDPQYQYGNPVTEGRRYIAGGGCDPNNPDTDGDGMGDAWEYAYGKAPSLGGAPTVDMGDGILGEILGAVTETSDDFTYVLNGVTVTYTQAPDPTRSGADDNQKRMSDHDLDADGDGLTNYQECLTAMMRQYRYDLDPEMARLYKGSEGELDDSEEQLLTTPGWKTLPNSYTAAEDLANPEGAASFEFIEQPIESALAQAIANIEWVVDPTREQILAGGAASKSRYDDAIHAALDTFWNSTIAFPTLDQLDAYNLRYLNYDDKVLQAKLGYTGTLTSLENMEYRVRKERLAKTPALLANAFAEMDAVWQRCLRDEALSNGDAARGYVKNDFKRMLETKWASEAEVRERNQRQFRAVMAKVDALLAQAQVDADAGLFPPVLEALLKANGDTQKIWAARKTQLLKMFVASAYDNSPTAAMDAAYDAVAEVSEGAYTKTEDMMDYLIDDPMSIYEEAVWNATNPLIQNRYRSALRGYEGGYWADTFTFGVIGWHGMIKPFAERVEDGIVLGMPLTEGLGGTDYPGWNGPASNIFTSNPLEADTDLDGMDDYFEVFHGLNPVLGDYVNAEWEDVNRNYSGVNRVGAARARAVATDAKLGWSLLTPSNNGFGSLIFNSESVTGFDYYTYPWLAGVPFADPDGDGLLNFEEAVNPVTSAPAHYGTDPSPLWMTDPANANSFVARFYTLGDLMWMGSLSDDAPMATTSVFPYEINEGYDTDGDGIGDNVELVSNSIFRGDPQTIRTPDRQQAAYFGGAGAMQTMADTQFGPQALTTFTLECWVKPDADQTSDEVVLIDRPWRFNDGATTEGAFRHNFVVGLRKNEATFKVFAYYTGAGTNTDGSEDTPKASPEVISGQTINANEWTHIAVTYDGARLVLLINGVESAAQASGLIPANGVLSVKSTIDSDVRRFTYRKAPIIIGAAPAATWKAALGDPEDDTAFDAYFTKCFKGFIDEVRIWNGARTAAQIADARARALTQTELLTLRYNAFMARYNGMGYFQANTPAEPLAIYTFNDLLAGSRDAATDDAPAQASDKPWEAYPSQQLMGATEAGSFTFRRKGFLATREAAAEPADYSRLTLDVLPTEAELFTSYYTLSVAKNLRSTKYAEGSTEDGAPTSEFVPKANNTVAHLPLADVVRAGNAPFTPMQLEEGSPELTFPSGTPENLKVADSFYWSPYRAGTQVSMDPIYSVKTTGNPYGYLYHGSIFFDALDYISRPAFDTQYPTDIFVYGDVFAKYDFETWDNSPSTDPAAGKTTTEAEGADWFRHQDTPPADTGDKLNDKYYSQGGYWLEQNIANGQTKDTDGDRMPNWWENYYGLDPEDPTGINGPHGDQDGDFLTNYAEHLASANPLKFSTVGNGVPDAQVPIWFRRGAPTFGMLYTDNDFMEDHWEASNRTERLTVDLNDAARDADGDGWSNFAEARANFRSGYHSTNPNAATSISQTGKIKLEMPTPALRMTVDYFGDQNVYTNATANAKIVVHTYTAKNNNSAPDATFNLPLAVGEGEEQETIEHEIGSWQRGTMSGFLHIGNIMPGSLKIRFTRKAVDTPYDEEEDKEDELYFNILSDTTTANNVAELYAMEPVQWIDAEGNMVANGYARRKAGSINYTTGEYTLDFTDAELWTEQGYSEDDEGNLTVYNRSEFVGVATYKYGVVAGKSNTFTLVKPDSGYIKEGLNNFFVFADLDADGRWDEGEPAGIPDQHDVDVGFDRVNETLHVALTEQAPPGAVRLDVASILGVLMTENDTNDALSGDLSSIVNPTTQQPLNPSFFASEQNYWLLLTAYENIGQTTVKEDPGLEVYRKQFNINKPYLSEDEIFGNATTKTGLPRSQAENQVAASYKVYLLPETQLGNHEQWIFYNIAVVTNVFGSLDAASTALVAPTGGAYLHNTDITFEWKCNVQVPAFGLTITKTADAAGNPVNKVVFADDDIRGVTPSATAVGTGAVEQFVYSYKLPRGVGELNAARDTLFGDGAYTYTVKLQPYNGSATVLTGKFNLQLNASGDAALAEMEGAQQDTTFNAQDSYYVRAQVRYNGVLKTADDFDYRNVVVEAHYSGSFNGNPVASTTDKLVYDAENEAAAKLNRCVKMVKDKEDGEFFSTRFDVELRGLATKTPVYLTAYFDLNGNGKRDAWEPWGYAAQGLDAVGGFYFDPLAVTPQSSGTTYQVEFYIQDVDTDNDKLADAWEWLQNGQRNTGSFFDDGTETGGWCNVFSGSYGDLKSSAAIWTTNVDGQLALTAYGAQLYGLTVDGTPDANGAVKVEGVEDMAAAKELLDLLGNEVALDLLAQGITNYGLTVNNISFTGDAVTLAWSVDTAVGVDGSIYDLTAIFSEGNNTAATYSVYGTTTLGGTWTKLAEVKVAGTQTPVVEIPVSSTVITAADGTTKQATFFKVILSATPMKATLE